MSTVTPIRALAAAQNGLALGAWCAMGSAGVVELACRAAPDFVSIDLQHGLVDAGSATSMLQLLTSQGPTPVVRMADHRSSDIGRVLDLGAEVVIVPQIETAAQARIAVDACWFPPRGHRSFGPTRAASLYGADLGSLEAHAACLVMIESSEALSNIDAICATPGLAGVYVGPADLAISLDLPVGAPITEPLEGALRDVVAACRKHNVVAGIHSYTASQAAVLHELGFTWITCAMDSRIVAEGFASLLVTARANLTPPLTP